jgi:hypothetical protein
VSQASPSVTLAWSRLALSRLTTHASPLPQGFGTCDRRRWKGINCLAPQDAFQLALQVLLCLSGCHDHVSESVKFQYVELVDFHVYVDIGLLCLQFLAHDRSL